MSDGQGGAIKRDSLGRVIPFCTNDGHPAAETGELLPGDRGWDMWICPVCKLLHPAFQFRDELERQAKLRESPDRPLTEGERIAQLEAEVAQLRLERPPR